MCFYFSFLLVFVLISNVVLFFLLLFKNWLVRSILKYKGKVNWHEGLSSLIFRGHEGTGK